MISQLLLHEAKSDVSFDTFIVQETLFTISTLSQGVRSVAMCGGWRGGSLRKVVCYDKNYDKKEKTAES